VVGEAIESLSELIIVCDLSTLWVNCSVFEKDLARLDVGQPVLFRVPDLVPAEFTGKVIRIDTEVNDRTRTVQVRAEVGNAGGLLRAHMFGSGEIQLDGPRTSLLVPREAVHRHGQSSVVFARKQPDRYEPHRVVVGEAIGDVLELAWTDLEPGDQVVTTGGFLLETEIQKGSIGAGCCGE
jgi:cobalt-zinc-cadmium efflux system membrane fusion protein